jgi:hypothetical protein
MHANNQLQSWLVAAWETKIVVQVLQYDVFLLKAQVSKFYLYPAAVLTMTSTCRFVSCSVQIAKCLCCVLKPKQY